MKRMIELAPEKGAFSWLTVIPMSEMDFTSNKREFRDALKQRYNWPIKDNPTRCAGGNFFNVDHAMICKQGGFVIQRRNELRDLEAEALECCLQRCRDWSSIAGSGEISNSGSNTSQDARLDVHARGLWERQRSAFFDIRVCHLNAEPY